MEVVSEGEENRKRDFVEKRQDYSAAGIAEYWIVDPQERKITVLALVDKDYREHGLFSVEDHARSLLLSDFSCAVSDVFAKCDEADGDL